MTHALGGDEAPELLDDDGGPAGNVHGELLESEECALAATVTDGVGDFGAAIESGGGQFVNRIVADEIADVGYDPLGASFDELIVVELADVVFDDGGLSGEDSEERL